MKTKQWLILLASCLALAAAPLTGCGGDDDPSANNGANNGGNNGDGNNGAGDAGTDTDDEGEDDADDEGDTDDDDEDATDPPQGECVVNDFFSGQTYTEGQNPDVHNGGELTPADEVTLNDANLQAVFDAVPIAADDEETEDVDESVNTLDEPIEVTDALVIATSRTDNPDTAEVIEGNDHLWLQDANAEIVFYRPFAEGEEPEQPIQVGDLVSFTVTEVTNFDGTPEITAVTDFSAQSPAEGEEENPVPFTDLTGDEITIDYWGELVRVSGQITADNGECGGQSKCFTLTHGEDGEHTIELRTSSQWVEEGVCATFLGPMGAFPTPLDPEGATPSPQLNSANWGWTFTEDPVTN